MDEYRLRYLAAVALEDSSNLSSAQRWVKAMVSCISPWLETQVV